MWVDAGFEPDTFWQQSPQTFQLVMRGVRKRMERQAEDDLRTAWHTAAFTAASQSKGGLKDLRYYLPRKPQKQSPENMLAMLRTLTKRKDA